MAEFKVPKHLSGYFNKLSREEREEFIGDYKNWYKHPYTEALIKDLEGKYEDLLKEAEAKDGFTTLFQSKYYDARNKAQRKTLRTILEQINFTL